MMNNNLFYDAIILGGSTAAMVCALKHAREGKQVLLTHSGTCLYSELTDAGDYRPVQGKSEWTELLFPAAIYDEGGNLHPDRLKLHGEALLEGSGVSILYAVQAVKVNRDSVTLAYKSGVFCVNAGEIYDLRKVPYIGKDSYILHYMRDKRHETSHFSTGYTADDAHSVYALYEEALRHLPEGAIPARSGTCLTQKNRISFDTAISLGVDALPVSTGIETEEQTTSAYDVIIAGGGTAGASAALFCGRQGLRTLLLEMNGKLGGTSTIGGVNTYWFGLREGAAAIIDRAVAEYRSKYHLPAKPGLWNDDDGFYPDVKAQALLKLCLDAGVDVRFNALVYSADAADNHVRGVRWCRNGVNYYSSACLTIDCTGDGDVCVLAGADYTYGNETDGMTYWASLAHYPTPDTYKNNFSTMVDVGNVWDYSRFIIAGRKLGDKMYDHGIYVAVRESRHIHGRETVTLNNLLSMKTVHDPLYSCFSNYDPKGRLTAELCYFGLIPPNQLYTIPRGACIPVTADGTVISGLLIGGKAISCTHDAFPGIRMQSDIERQGLALAALAGCTIEQNTSAAEAEGIEQRILSLGGDNIIPVPAENAPLSEVVCRLTGDEPWDWLETSVTDFETGVSPIIRIMTADSDEAVKLLMNRFREDCSDKLKLCLARLLLFHRCSAGADIVLAEIKRQLSESRALPQRTGSVNYGQMLPDHGLMPETVYLINALAYAPDTDIVPMMTEVLDKLSCMPRDWHNIRAGIYCWCESFAFTASRRNDQSMISLILRLLRLPEFITESDDPLLNERLHMLKITLLAALHKLGNAEGTSGLKKYLNEKRSSLAHAAGKSLGS